LVQTLRPNTLRSNIFLQFSVGPSVENTKCCTFKEGNTVITKPTGPYSCHQSLLHKRDWSIFQLLSIHTICVRYIHLNVILPSASYIFCCHIFCLHIAPPSMPHAQPFFRFHNLANARELYKYRSLSLCKVVFCLLYLLPLYPKNQQRHNETELFSYCELDPQSYRPVPVLLLSLPGCAVQLFVSEIC
jgi:hypothetical protein